jgi:hypothetical protein
VKFNSGASLFKIVRLPSLFMTHLANAFFPSVASLAVFR